MRPELKRCRDRWYPLKDHPVQLALIDAVKDGVRFPLVPAGRRSGKTERFKRFLAKTVLNKKSIVGKYFAAAPTHDQAKRIFWDDLLLFTFSFLHEKKPNKTDRIIYLPTGSEIHVVGLDQPARFEGTSWIGGGVDEVANLKEQAVNENIMPALNTENPTMDGYLAWCWFFGVPDGLGHYYDMCQKAEAGITPDRKVYHWKSADILSPKVIKEAKDSMSEQQFRQEYEASFETAQGRIYPDYNKENHTTRTIQPHEQLLWMHDQNFTPLSSSIGVRDNDDLYLLDEIVLTSAISLQSALEFVEKFKNHKNKNVILYGDASGKAGEKHGHESDYTDIEGVLRSHGWQVTRRIKAANPPIKDRQNAVRAKVKTANGKRSLFINPNTAAWSDKGLATVQLQEGSTFQEDQKNQYQHITTAIGYMIDYEWSINKPILDINIGMAM